MMAIRFLASTVAAGMLLLPATIEAQDPAASLARCERVGGRPPATAREGETPVRIDGVTTVTVATAACLIETLGEHLVVVHAMGDSLGVPGAFRVAQAGRAEPSYDNTRAVGNALGYLADGDRSRPILVYCHHERCGLSPNAAIRMRGFDYENIFWLREGVEGWKRAGHPLAPVTDALLPADEHAYPVLTNMPSVQVNGWLPRPIEYGTDGYFDVPGVDNYDLCRAIKVKSDAYDAIELLERAAGVGEGDGNIATTRKMEAFWARYGPRLVCDGLIPEHVLKYAVSHGNYTVLITAVERWRVPVNDVDYADGQTLLDFVAAKYDRLGDYLDVTQAAYDLVRNAGGKHRSELEGEGLYGVRSLQARFLPAWRSAAERGSVRALVHLAGVYIKGVGVERNASLGQAYHRQAEERALELGDLDMVMHLALEHTTDTDGVKLLPADDARAFALFKAAADRGSVEGLFWMGRAYYGGHGVAKDLERALQIFLEVDRRDFGTPVWLMLARTYDAMGNDDMMLKWMRWLANMGSGQAVLYTNVGQTIEQWFQEKSLAPCGPLPRPIPVADPVCKGSPDN